MFDNMDEQTARFTFNAACGLSAFAAAASIMLGMRELQGEAAVFLVFAATACAYGTSRPLGRDSWWRNETISTTAIRTDPASSARRPPTPSQTRKPVGS